ncbi:hypothetical protein KL918_000407 [Ogataea parapolymorpha]|uniref:Uncharacterized protein n=1 Tax=Ogataea parapolymorpha (strain ATCC 26012 / BCRC 20466 / JCM 22074 / NRRL Y-7560 / DL-1) TaxID=871575 RepID=W1Q7U4_OGAPD|nr:hypothetical protein HPODL_03077 [Ogataea parapolymorpha DL-1]ESW96454.1 hypothetical protein HPODL_03077 [Ogataea parapolymorpha DL-1]KAG7870203.1 hypothetical protein KL918_000407 [Ogataea parapolymorpha]KAG7875152.1 hypothetical protein KL916_000764 [Ogataea parapolymorpha]
MSDSRSRLLSQIPLIVMPGKYTKPHPVTLPYDFEQLPASTQIFKQQELDVLISQLDNLRENQRQMADQVRERYGETALSNRSRPFDDWEQNIRRVAPGYFGADGKVNIMTPTRHHGEHEKQQEREQHADVPQSDAKLKSPEDCEPQLTGASYDLANLRIE